MCSARADEPLDSMAVIMQQHRLTILRWLQGPTNGQQGTVGKDGHWLQPRLAVCTAVLNSKAACVCAGRHGH